MSPILVRPVREQLEHDRVIRLLQQELSKRKVEVEINPGAEENAAVSSAGRKEYPDAVVYSIDKGRKLIGVVEVETGESVNNLEAMAQWAHFAKFKVPFHLYVPMSSVDVARRLSSDQKIVVDEIWSFHQIGEQLRFALAHRSPTAGSTLMSRVRPSPSVSARPRPLPVVIPLPEPPPTPVRTKAVAVVEAQAPKAATANGKSAAVPLKTGSPAAKATVAPKRMPAPVQSVAKPALGKGIPARITPAPRTPLTPARPPVASTGKGSGAATPAGLAKAAPVEKPTGMGAKALAGVAKAPAGATKATTGVGVGRTVAAPAVKGGVVAKAARKIVKPGKPAARPPRAMNYEHVAKPKILTKSAPKVAAKSPARVVRKAAPARKPTVKKAARRGR